MIPVLYLPKDERVKPFRDRDLQDATSFAWHSNKTQEFHRALPR